MEKRPSRAKLAAAGRLACAVIGEATGGSHRLRHMNVLFVASVAVIAADPPQSRKLFIDALGLPLEDEGDGYYSSTPAGTFPAASTPAGGRSRRRQRRALAHRSGPRAGWCPRHQSSSRWRTRKLSQRQGLSSSARALSYCTQPAQSRGDRR